MSILALDPSLTATGWALSSGTSGVFTPSTEFARGVDRLRWHRWKVTVRVVVGVQLVVLEGYAFGRPNQAHQLGELGGVLRCAIADAGIPFVEIPPAKVKMFATGKGDAKKDAMLDAAIAKLGYTGRDHNEADALWLLAMAKAHYSPSDKVDDYQPKPSPQERALAGVRWPQLSSPIEEPAHA